MGKIPPGAAVARTEIQCKEAGVIRGIREGAEAIRRILVQRADLFTITTTKALRQSRQFACGWHGNCAWVTEESGMVLEVKPGLRGASPVRRFLR